VASQGAESVLAQIRREPGKSTSQLRHRQALDMNWLRDRLAELVAEGRAVCLNGRWFPRGQK
jgi:hypothetical protein